MIKEIENSYIDSNNNEYIFRISKSIDGTYYDIMLFCFLNRSTGPMYECDQYSINDLPSESVSDEAKKYISKFIKNIAFT